MNTADAAYHVVHDYPGGSESLGPRVDISAAVLRNKVNRTQPKEGKRHHLTLEEAVRITDFTDDDRILRAWARQRGLLLVKAPAGASECDMGMLEKVAAFMIASGVFGKEIYDSLADGRVDQREVGRVENAGNHVMTEVAEVVQRMKGMVG
ncbi:phage regulatory CII family protein [Castellaniella ginsengisoli]|uniref:Phage regulatory CII family protein n=1 Tax=Castellaniella ginsengisoli TaxID=546114 RepID=A0AB39ERX0_9BURK